MDKKIFQASREEIAKLEEMKQEQRDKLSQEELDEYFASGQNSLRRIEEEEEKNEKKCRL